MVRYEVKTPHKSFVGCEPTLKEAKRYIASLVEEGVEILNVEYYDRDERVDDQHRAEGSRDCPRDRARRIAHLLAEGGDSCVASEGEEDQTGRSQHAQG